MHLGASKKGELTMRKDTSAAIWSIWIQHAQDSLAIESEERYTYPRAWSVLRKMTMGKKPFSFGILYKGE